MLARQNRFQKGRRAPKALALILLGTCFFVVLAFLAISNWRMYQKRAALDQQTAALEQELAKLEGQADELKTRITQTDTEEYTERVARERLNLKRQGEEVVAIVFPEDRGSERQEEEKSWWDKLLEKIGL